MDFAPRFRITDPLAIARSRRNFSIKRRRPFPNHPGQPACDALDERLNDLFRFRPAQTDVHFDARITQFLNAAPRHFFKRILYRHEHARHFRRDQRIGARRGFSKMTAWLKCHHHITTRWISAFFPAIFHRLNFRVRRAEFFMISLTNHNPIAQQHTTHHRIGLHATLPS